MSPAVDLVIPSYTVYHINRWFSQFYPVQSAAWTDDLSSSDLYCLPQRAHFASTVCRMYRSFSQFRPVLYCLPHEQMIKPVPSCTVYRMNKLYNQFRPVLSTAWTDDLTSSVLYCRLHEQIIQPVLSWSICPLKSWPEHFVPAQPSLSPNHFIHPFPSCTVYPLKSLSSHFLPVLCVPWIDVLAFSVLSVPWTADPAVRSVLSEPWTADPAVRSVLSVPWTADPAVRSVLSVPWTADLARPTELPAFIQTFRWPTSTGGPERSGG